MHLKTIVPALLFALLAGCQGGGTTTVTVTETQTATHQGWHPPAPGEPCPLDYFHLEVNIFDAQTGNRNHVVTLLLDDERIQVEGALGQDSGRTIRNFGPFRIPYRDILNATWSIDGEQLQHSFQPECAPTGSFVEFEFEGSGRQIHTGTHVS